ncbi:MAG: DUF983 domain-containing protein [Hyphomicrobiales bacterium]|nr:DUF983 domain-containing protein [Hyphomicrobiales bacterium]
MSKTPFYPPLSPVSTGLAGRCPRCGEGRLFSGYLKPAERCEACGLDLNFADSGDGPAVFIILLLGFVIVGGALFVELTWQPALWVHALLWIPLTVIIAGALLRPLKGIMIAQQYVTAAEEGRLAGPDDAGD